MKTRLALAAVATALIVVASVHIGTRSNRTVSAPRSAQESSAVDPGAADVAAITDVVDVAATAGSRSPVAPQASSAAPTDPGSIVLRVIVDGLRDEDLGGATVTVTSVDASGSSWRAEVQDSWPCQGRTSEYDLEPFVAAVTQWGEGLRVDEVDVRVDHPERLSESVRVELSAGDEDDAGRTVYEARLQLADVVWWSELALIVRDADTHEHLEDVELRAAPTAFMGLVQQPGASYPFTVLGEGLHSPVTVRGGRRASGAEDHVGGIAVGPGAGDSPPPLELVMPESAERGVMVYARAPGYAWGRLVLDVSKDADREIRLRPGASLGVKLENVQLDAYAALEKRATFRVRRIDSEGEDHGVFHRELDVAFEAEGVQLDALDTGVHTVIVDLSGSWRRTPHVLAREEVSLAAGESRQIRIELPDAPEPRPLVTLSGVLAFPSFGGEHDVRLELFADDYRYGDPDVGLSLADMESVGGDLPTWSFRVEALPVGTYQARLMPFEKNWMIEVPPGGRDDVELMIPELAEVLVETVNVGTGERVPLEQLRYGTREDLPGRVRHEWSTVERTAVAFDGEPGRFRLWMAPGPAYIGTWSVPRDVDIGARTIDVELVAGLQSVPFELAPPCRVRFEFRVDGDPLPWEDGIFVGLGQRIRAVDHGGSVDALRYWLFEASAPGLYAIDFGDHGTDRFLPIPPRRVELREGETTDVIVELERK